MVVGEGGYGGGEVIKLVQTFFTGNVKLINLLSNNLHGCYTG